MAKIGICINPPPTHPNTHTGSGSIKEEETRKTARARGWKGARSNSVLWSEQGHCRPEITAATEPPQNLYTITPVNIPEWRRKVLTSPHPELEKADAAGGGKVGFLYGMAPVRSILPQSEGSHTHECKNNTVRRKEWAVTLIKIHGTHG